MTINIYSNIGIKIVLLLIQLIIYELSHLYFFI